MASDAVHGLNGLRVAVLSDIHGNIRALEAVLGEVEREQPDRIVVCGDVSSGPFTAETLARLMELEGEAVFIRGNADRAVVSAYDQGLAFDLEEENPPGWSHPGTRSRSIEKDAISCPGSKIGHSWRWPGWGTPASAMARLAAIILSCQEFPAH